MLATRGDTDESRFAERRAAARGRGARWDGAYLNKNQRLTPTLQRLTPTLHWGSGELSPLAAFGELCKIVFIKLRHENGALNAEIEEGSPEGGGSWNRLETR
jgi:hypothetical protein